MRARPAQHDIFNRRLLPAMLMLTVALLLPGLAWAQVPGPGTPPPAMPAWDVGGSVGWFNVRTVIIAPPESFSRWQSDSLAGTFSAGRYWTENVKTEIDVGLTTEISTTNYEPYYPEVQFGCCQVRIDSTRLVKVSVGQVYQFGHNSRFHPFVGAGIDLDIARVRSVRPEQQVWTYPAPRESVPEHRAESTTRTPRAFAVAGYKAYFSRRVFFRNDLRISAGKTLHQFTVRIGVGVDF